MTTRLAAEATRVAAGDDRVRYDHLEMTFHWLTALLVVSLYGLYQGWGFAQRGSPLRHEMQALHVSLGVTLTVVLIARIAWRIAHKRRMLPATTGAVEVAAQAVHYLLYGLLIAIAGVGFCFRWAQQEPFTVFGLFDVPTLYPFPKSDAKLLGSIHYWIATTIIVLAGLHAAAALFHHYVVRDDVLWRMLPGIRARRAEASSKGRSAV